MYLKFYLLNFLLQNALVSGLSLSPKTSSHFAARRWLFQDFQTLSTFIQVLTP